MNKRPIAILFVTLFIDMLGFGLILPLLPVYIKHYGGSPLVSGLLMASFSFTQFLFAPIWGRLSDRYGRRPFILLSLFGSAFTYLSFGLATSLTMLFVARLASGVLTAAGMPTSQAYITDVTTPENRAGGMAVLGAAFGLGFAFGPAIGGVLSHYSVLGLPSIATPSIFAALMALTNAIVALFALPESHKDRIASQNDGKRWYDAFIDVNRAMKNPNASRPIMVFTLLTFAFAAVESCFSWLVLLRFHEAIELAAQKTYALTNPGLSWLQALPNVRLDFIEKAQGSATSQLFLIVGITILITQGAVMGGLSKRIGEKQLICFGLGLLTLALFGIAMAPTLPLIKVLSAMIAIGSGVSNPSLSAIIMQSAKHEDRGLISGAQQGLSSLARIFAPPINNYLVGVNSAVPFVISGFLMGMSFLVSLSLKAIPRSKGAKAEAPLAH